MGDDPVAFPDPPQGSVPDVHDLLPRQVLRRPIVLPSVRSPAFRLRPTLKGPIRCRADGPYSTDEGRTSVGPLV